METSDVIVAGGGIIGLSIAMELARHDLRVRVLEKGRAMAEASWAAAGMLSTHDPNHPPALASLASLSSQLYPDYLHTVETLSGWRVPLRTRAALVAGDIAYIGWHQRCGHRSPLRSYRIAGAGFGLAPGRPAVARERRGARLLGGGWALS